VIEAVFRGVRPPAATYVSCNPEALAAELPAILDAGYRATRIRPVDMFPHTPHVEVVLTVERIEARASRGRGVRR
jgi:23S rRNA (uracil1939-C5)-methyltransferase